MTQHTEALPAAPAQSLTQKRIFIYWIPLAASWLLMAAEMPYVNAMLARLGEAERMIAAFGVVAALSITIESPVINLLATSTALARSRQNYLMLRRFALHLIIATTILHILMSWTPLFDLVVVRWMGVPRGLVEPILLGMRLMLVWSGAIAWRRFIQGILIRYGKTRFVGQGTVIRLLTSVAAATALALSGRFSGVAVGTLALSLGVFAEAVYAHWVARETIADHFGPDAPQSDSPDLSYRQLLRFHTPLAATSMLFLMAQPLIGAALSRGPEPEKALAAWPVLAGLLFFSRAPGMALPEAVIALHAERGSFAPLRSFSARLGWLMLALLALVSFTPASRFYFQSLIGLSDELSRLAVSGAQLGLLLPLMMAWTSFYRGVLTARQITWPVSLGMLVELFTLATVLLLGVLLRAPGVPLAAVAISLSMGADVLILHFSNQRLKPAG